MIKSMTAFASVTENMNDCTVEVESRSYNHRFLDISLRLPRKYSVLEDKIKALIIKKIARGRVEIKLTVSQKTSGLPASDLPTSDLPTSDSDLNGSLSLPMFEIDKVRALSYYNCLVELKKMFDLEGKITIDQLCAGTEIINKVELEDNLEEQWPLISQCVQKSLEKLDKMRKTEGEFLAEDFIKRLMFIENSIKQIEDGSCDLHAQYFQRLKERINTLTKGTVELDEARVAQEAAFLADKSDISEEIVRAVSHIKQFRDILVSEAVVGKKLNFLIQEFNREFNTIGSKTGSAEISHIVVAVKSELEKLREQIQNVE